MSKKEIDQKAKELAALAMTKVGPDGVVEIAADDQNLMSQATYFRTMATLREEDIVGLVKKGLYKSIVPPPMLRARDFQAHLKMTTMVFNMIDYMTGFQEDYFEAFFAFLVAKRDMCLSCDIYLACFAGEKVECPHDIPELPEGKLAKRMELLREQFSRMIVSRESCISDHEGGSGEEKKVQLSRESFPSKGDPGSGKPPPSATPRADPRSLIRKGLADSREAEKHKQPTMRAQLKELKAVWDDCLVARHGESFVSPKWGMKANKNLPLIIKNYGLELTKKAVLLYFQQWDNIKAENTWIDAPTPTAGLFLHFQENLFSAVQGKGQVVGERASKRTADEPDYEVSDGQDIGQFPTEASHKA